MIYYIDGLTEQEAKSISEELYNLSIGSLSTTSTTKYLLDFFKHPKREGWALKFNETQSLPLFLNNTIDQSLEALKALFLNDLTTEETVSFTTYINNIKENTQVILLKDILPLKTKSRFKTYEQLEAEDWFPQESMEL